jgi:hypothetical protein
MITVVFPPTDFTFESSKLTQVQGFGLFGSLRELQFSMDESQRSLKIINGIEGYRQANITGKVIINMVRNPMNRKTSDSFKIYVTDSLGEKLAIIENGVTYTARSGTV